MWCLLRLKARTTCLKVWAVVGSFFDSPEHLRAPTGADVHLRGLAQYRAQSDRNRIAVRTVAPTRGVIVDRSGNLLAVNTPSFTLAITPERADDLDAVLTSLRDLLGLSETDIELFTEARKRRRPLSPVPLKYRLTDEELAVIAVNKHVLSGVSVLSELTRHYPEGDLLGHALGYVGRIGIDDIDASEKDAYRGISHIGKVGLEAYHEDALKGGLGVSRIETNARGVYFKCERFLHQPTFRNEKTMVRIKISLLQ